MSSDSFSSALADLDPASRALLDLSLRRGMRPEEIAEMLGADAATVADSRDEALRRVAAAVGMESEEQLDEVRARLAELPAEEWLGAAAPKPAPVAEPKPEPEAPEPVAAEAEPVTEPEPEVAEPAPAASEERPDEERARRRAERERRRAAAAEAEPPRERTRPRKKRPEPEREPELEPRPSPTARPPEQPPKPKPLVRPAFLWALAATLLLAGIAALASLGAPAETETETEQTTTEAKELEPEQTPTTTSSEPTAEPQPKPEPDKPSKPDKPDKPNKPDKPKPAKPPVRLTGIARGASGTAQVTDGGQRLTLKLSGLPAPKDAAYTVWLYTSVIDAKALGAGRAGKIEIDARLPSDWRKYRYVDVSREPTDGNSSHSGESVARVRTAKLR